METEVRGRIYDSQSYIEKLLDLGFTQTKSEDMDDYAFDHPDLRLKQSGQKIRIRIYPNSGKAQLCWKGKKHYTKQTKSREEVEINTKDISQLFKLLKRLGFEQTREVKRYIKQYERKDVTIRIEWFWDLPGLVLSEIEGSEEDISQTVRELKMPVYVFGPWTLTTMIKQFYKEKKPQEVKSMKGINYDKKTISV